MSGSQKEKQARNEAERELRRRDPKTNTHTASRLSWTHRRGRCNEWCTTFAVQKRENESCWKGEAGWTGTERSHSVVVRARHAERYLFSDGRPA